MSRSTQADSKARPQSILGWKATIPAIGICFILLHARMRGIGWPLPIYDFMTYWAGGRLFLSGANPYNAAAMYAIERGLGWQYTQPLVLLNPPWALPYIALFGLLPFKVVHLLWWGLTMAMEAACAMALWKYFGGEASKRWIALVVAITFLPGGAAERMGQITPFMLAGLTASLLLLHKRRDMLAGICLIALGMKPHLLYLVVLAIICWTVQSRRWKIAIGAVSIYVLSTAAAIAFNHQALGYFHGSTQAAMDTICGVGGALRSIFGMQMAWLQFVPTVFGSIWFAFYWKKHRNAWVWQQRIPTLVLVSLATAPYSWSHDYVLVFPAVLSLAVALSKTRTDWVAPAGCYFIVQMVIFNMCNGLPKAWVSTASLLWLAFYYGIRHYCVRRIEMPAAACSPQPISGYALAEPQA